MEIANSPTTTVVPTVNRPLLVWHVAKMLHVCDRRVRQLAKSGILPAFKIDRKSWGIRRQDLEAYILRRERSRVL